jgi:RNA polymerase sigma factor (sigma-70 family)
VPTAPYPPNFFIKDLSQTKPFFMEPILLTAEDIFQFNKGDRNAFDKVYKTFYKPVYYFTRKLLNDEDEAKDITQETFEKLWKLNYNFGTCDNIRAFVMLTARNACFNFLRNAKRRNEAMRKSADSMDVAVDHEVVEREAFIAWLQTKTIEVIDEVLAELPADKCELLRLYLLEGFSKVQIAERYGITPNTANYRIQKALVQLRMRLEPRGIVLIFIVVINFLKKLFN